MFVFVSLNTVTWLRELVCEPNYLHMQFKPDTDENVFFFSVNNMSAQFLFVLFNNTRHVMRKISGR